MMTSLLYEKHNFDVIINVVAVLHLSWKAFFLCGIINDKLLIANLFSLKNYEYWIGL